MKRVARIILFLTLLFSCNPSYTEKVKPVADSSAETKETVAYGETPGIDTVLYNSIMLHLYHDEAAGGWLTETGLPLPGSILPFKRIVAYYGNFYSAKMGALGGWPPDEMLLHLEEEVKKWEKVDTLLPVQPALQYIAVTAQRSPGKDAKYRLRMPFHEIDKALQLAMKINAILFLDIQVGQSTLQEELPVLEPYLRLPNVHLAIDPEYSMKEGQIPCTTIGTFDAADINYASAYLVSLVHSYGLPPKILIVHRFIKPMITNYEDIHLHPEVQLIVNMDGFGSPAKKIGSYMAWVAGEPVQFTGFKLFYDNDVVTGGRLMTPEEILKLNPQPIYIQYQ